MLDKTWVRDLGVKSPNLICFFNKCLKVIPQDFKKAVASTSGKYHPFFSRMDGGLLHGHTRYAMMFALHLCEYWQLTEYEKDQVVIAMFLHDAFKGGKPGNNWHHTIKDHALVAYEEFKKIEISDLKMMDGTILNGAEAKENILSAIRFHMAQWSYPKDEIRMALDARWKNKVVLIVQTSDYISSKQDIVEFVSGLHGERMSVEK